MQQYQIDFQQLRIKHILFKSKVRSVLYGGKQDVDFFSQRGPIMEWFRVTGGEHYSQEPELRMLHRTHQTLTSHALQLFRVYDSGRIEQAHEGLKEIELGSEQFLTTLSQFEKRLSSLEMSDSF
ncbi:histidine kinase [Pontibacter sp. E15-1]|uniref:histidine kinase n=1 Tax=Pontibacter sp. E15-1 TaxID=2919918 RepID=UPI001F502F39|nr:histidine kinase [Pontibacter sp. E15-1]MCJ8165047.1 histidine kinase [Pontibacter sp. E15-1]